MKQWISALARAAWTRIAPKIPARLIQYGAMALQWASRLFGNAPKQKLLIALFLAIFLLAGLTLCHAAESRLSFEAGRTIVRGPTPAAALTVRWLDSGPADADFECGVVLVGETAGNRNQYAVHCLLVDGFGPLEIGLGPAILQHDDAYNSGRINFSLVLGWRITERVRLQWRHFSNAGSSFPNRGRDMLLASVSLR